MTSWRAKLRRMTHGQCGSHRRRARKLAGRPTEARPRPAALKAASLVSSTRQALAGGGAVGVSEGLRRQPEGEMVGPARVDVCQRLDEADAVLIAVDLVVAHVVASIRRESGALLELRKEPFAFGGAVEHLKDDLVCHASSDTRQRLAPNPASTCRSGANDGQPLLLGIYLNDQLAAGILWSARAKRVAQRMAAAF